jgi:hypothetical protein
MRVLVDVAAAVVGSTVDDVAARLIELLAMLRAV